MYKVMNYFMHLFLIFTVLVIWVHRVVHTPSLKMISFLHLCDVELMYVVSGNESHWSSVQLALVNLA